MKGASRFHVIVFASDLQGEIRSQLNVFSEALEGGFFAEFGGNQIFNVVLVTKSLPFQFDNLRSDPGLQALINKACIVFDDRPPDEDAHCTVGVDHDKGAVVVVRPDLWVGTSLFSGEAGKLKQYFDQFLLSGGGSKTPSNGIISDSKPQSTDKLAGEISGKGKGCLVYSTPSK